jgi:hypothetical protein
MATAGTRLGEQADMIGDETARAEEVYRRWRRTSLDVMGRASWAGWTLEDAGFMSSMGAAMLLIFLEPTLWFQSWPPWSFTHQAAVWLGLLSLVAVPVHGLLLDRFLSAKTPLEQSMPRWLLALRFMAACIPLFSFVLLPGWKTFLARRPSWANPRIQHGLNLESENVAVHRGRLRIYTSGFFGVYLAFAFALPIFWALWLTQTGALGAARKPVIAGVCVTLHLVALAGARLYFTPLRQARSTLLVTAAPWLCLVPVLGPLVAMVGPGLLTEDRDGAQPLTWSVWARRSETGRLPLWRSMERDRQGGSAMTWLRQWQRPRRKNWDVQAGEHERALLSFYRGKTALLLLEGAVLLVGLNALAKRFPALTHAVDLAVRGAVHGGICLAALGLLILGVAAIDRLLRLRNTPPELAVFGRYLLLVPLALLAGVQAGFLWLARDLRDLGILMGYGGALLAIFGWMFFLPSRHKVSRTSMSWLLSFLLLGLCGAPVGLNERLQGWPARVLTGAALLAPLWSLLLFRRFAPWLPRPLAWRDIKNRQIPGRIRTTLIFLGITAAVPGGGLAIPVWIALRVTLSRPATNRLHNPGPSPAIPP